MITLLLHLFWVLLFLFGFGGHRHLALENVALRQQLAVYKRTATRPPLRSLIASSASGSPESGPGGDSPS